MATRTSHSALRGPALNAETEQAEANRVSASLAGLAAALLFIVLGLFVVHHLYNEGRVEDCLMAGRNNCDQLLIAVP